MAFALRAGDMDRRITLQQATVIDDGFTKKDGPPADLTTVWAMVTPVSDGERFGGGAVRSTITTRFTIRWSSTVAVLTEKDFVSYAGKSFGIVSIKELGRRQGLEISATAQN